MGFSLSWAVIKGCGKQPVLELLGCRGTGSLQEVLESELSGATLPDGSYVIVSERDMLKLATEDIVARRLSGLGETIVCLVEEHTMCSMAECWRGGVRLWSIYHDSNVGGVLHLETEGQLPPCCAEIDKRLHREQETNAKSNVDYIYDIPVEVAWREGGYRHDMALPGMSERSFEELVPTGHPGSGPMGVTDFTGTDFAGKPPWWWRWCRWIFRP
jgi:hypothetical protein